MADEPRPKVNAVRPTDPARVVTRAHRLENVRENSPAPAPNRAVRRATRAIAKRTAVGKVAVTATNRRTRRRVAIAVAAFPVLGIGMLMMGSPSPEMLANASGSGSSTSSSVCSGSVPAILATIRTRESSGNYTATSTDGRAHGAYQFQDPTWLEEAAAAGVNAALYPHASDAPPELQDQVAASYVTRILNANAGDINAVPVKWYLGHVPAAGSPEWDQVPAPEAGNTLTPREYAAKWLTVYAAQTGATISCATSTPTPTGSAGQTQVPAELLGFGNGRLPASMLMAITPSGHRLYPPAARSWLTMVDAAALDGLDLHPRSGIDSAYRTLAEQYACADSKGIYGRGGWCAVPSQSNHGWGLAVDVDLSDTRIGIWMTANAARFGWVQPMADEPWHFEYRGNGGN